MACLLANPDARPAGAFEIEAQLKAVAKYLGLKTDDIKGIEDEENEEWSDEG